MVVKTMGVVPMIQLHKYLRQQGAWDGDEDYSLSAEGSGGQTRRSFKCSFEDDSPHNSVSLFNNSYVPSRVRSTDEDSGNRSIHQSVHI
jgi:hypothetical protein